MARKRDRVFALVVAAAFLVTAVGTSVGVIWQIAQENKKDNTTADSTGDTSSTAKDDNKDKLEGTKMQDFTPVDSVSELQKTDLVKGEGDEVKAGDTVTVHYTGAVAKTGTVFQSSKDFGEPVSFALDGVIAGWTEGVPGMNVGGTRRLVIPAEKAYGANPPSGSNIPANADLVFDIELIKIGK